MASAAGARAEVSALKVMNTDPSDVTRVTITITMRNVGLAPFTQPLGVCARVGTQTARVGDAAGWVVKDGMLCGTAPPLPSRADAQLAAVPLTIHGGLASNRYVEISVTARHPPAAGEIRARCARDTREIRARCARLRAELQPQQQQHGHNNNNTATTTGLSEQSYSHKLRIATDQPTLSGCDDLCMCRHSI